MSDGDSNYCSQFDFGEGFEHVKSIFLNGKVIKNSGYLLDESEQVTKISILKIISAE